MNAKPMTSYHKSRYIRPGFDYAQYLVTDLDGYVHLTPAGWLAAPMDAAGGKLTPSKAKALAKSARASTVLAELSLTEHEKESAEWRKQCVAKREICSDH